ncbi:phage holin family protein [Denitrobaculum tricleocarpae]|uniref:Phage holin family protein n=1 Tax=Denitrobaculum tricleocarpae TaxID=2591009 RepID=A0A545SYR2_9PROT|nr:phage holin family protein [Denitrobaculum tricleocarpae]TQV70088.1 phage holin family protein [Denitrobaculum tricleocarpae]
MSNQDLSIKSLLSGLVDQISQLVRQELRLAQAEVSQKIAQAQAGGLAVFAGMLLAFCALLILLQALVLALSNIMPPTVAAILVSLTTAAVAFALIKQGQRKLKVTNLVPERTIAAVRRDKELVMEKTK